MRNIWKGEAKNSAMIATWATAEDDELEGFGFKWSWPGRSSKHFPFDWSSQDQF